MAALLCARLEELGEAPPKVAILFHGFLTPLPSNPPLRWWRDLAPSSLRTPTLVVCGSADPVDAGGQAARLAALFATSRVHVVSNGAHAMPREEEDLAAISTFCRAALCGRAALGGGEVGAASAGQAGASPPRVVPVCCE
mmetsp:Transcript_30027/g.94717  ORF Transcript_30027/g.94717 Transcript_30027/m.94717 type:complete len:140 (+) Transcript_30027:434-853(+)